MRDRLVTILRDQAQVRKKLDELIAFQFLCVQRVAKGAVLLEYFEKDVV